MENTITVRITTDDPGVAEQVVQLVRATLEKLQAEGLVADFHLWHEPGEKG